jgi:enoyl-CoA hydratase/carnithine racemase
MAETTYETIIVRRGGGAVRVVLNRPEKKNAVNAAMWDDLTAVLADISRREEDRVLVLSGAGGAFCSGADWPYRPSPASTVTPSAPDATWPSVATSSWPRRAAGLPRSSCGAVFRWTSAARGSCPA